jgi:hypothetical protein
MGRRAVRLARAQDARPVTPGPGTAALLLPDAGALADLATFVGRAKRVDPDGAARLVGHGDVLAVYVSPVNGGGGPTVLGLRTVALAAPSDLDVTVPLAALTDRFARPSGPSSADPADLSGPVALAVPPAPATGVAWAGISPPRSGWEAVGLVEAEHLRRVAAAGIAEVSAGAPSGSGGQAVARLRAGVWGRPLVEGAAGAVAGVPAGVAYTAEALGFVDDAEPAALFVAGPWSRLTTSRGHVLARRPALV